MLSEAQRVADWVQYHTGKFTIKQISGDTGISRHNVQNRITELKQAGLVRVLCKDGTVCLWGKVRPAMKIKVEQYDWTPNMEKVTAIYQVLDTEAPMCVKLIAGLTKISAETVTRYLIVMAYMQNVIIKSLGTSRYGFVRGLLYPGGFKYPSYQTAKKAVDNLYNFARQGEVVKLPEYRDGRSKKVISGENGDV